MAYDYQTQRERIFTERGQTMFLSIRDRSKRLLKDAGAARMQELISGETGDTWDMLACVDRLVELGELYELKGEGSVPGQFRVFVSSQ